MAGLRRRRAHVVLYSRFRQESQGIQQQEGQLNTAMTLELREEQTAPADTEPVSIDHFTAMVEQYTNFGYNVAFRMMPNVADVDDVVQDAFLSAYRARDRFRGDAQVTTWFYRIVVNAALQRIRKDKRPRQMNQASVEDIEVVDTSPSPESEAENSELHDRLEAAIAELPEDMRIAVILRDVKQLSAKEAAEVVGVRVSTLKSRLRSGRLVLREQLSNYGSSQLALSARFRTPRRPDDSLRQVVRTKR